MDMIYNTLPYDLIKKLVDNNQGNMTLYELIGKAIASNIDQFRLGRIVSLTNYYTVNMTLHEIIGDYEKERYFYMLINLILIGLTLVVTVLGLVGNIISLIVWSRPHLRSSTSVVLIGLAVCDSLVILCGKLDNFPTDYLILKDYKGEKSIDSIVIILYDFYMAWIRFVCFYLHRAALTASVYLTVVITVERFICICYPFQFEEWCSFSRTCKFVAITIIFSVIYQSTVFWEYRILGTEILVPGNPIVVLYGMKPTELLLDQHYDELRNTWLYIFFDYLLPLTSIIIMNAITYIKLKRINKERRTMTSVQKNENKLTTMTLYVVAEFLVFTSFKGLVSLSRLNPQLFSGYHSYQKYVLMHVPDLLNTLNSSVNFVTYVSSWQPFRKTFMKMFCCLETEDRRRSASPGKDNKGGHPREDGQNTTSF